MGWVGWWVGLGLGGLDWIGLGCVGGLVDCLMGG